MRRTSSLRECAGLALVASSLVGATPATAQTTPTLVVLTQVVDVSELHTAIGAVVSASNGTATFYVPPQVDGVIRIEPGRLVLRRGEVARFAVTSTGVVPHEFVRYDDTVTVSVVRDDGVTAEFFVTPRVAPRPTRTPSSSPSPSPSPTSSPRLDPPSNLTFRRQIFCWRLCPANPLSAQLPQYEIEPPGVVGYLTSPGKDPASVVRIRGNFRVIGVSGRGEWIGKLHLAPLDQQPTEVKVVVKHGWPLAVLIALAGLLLAATLERFGLGLMTWDRGTRHRVSFRSLYPPYMIMTSLLMLALTLAGGYAVNDTFGSFSDYVLLVAFTFGSAEAAHVARRGAEGIPPARSDRPKETRTVPSRLGSPPRVPLALPPGTSAPDLDVMPPAPPPD